MGSSAADAPRKGIFGGLSKLTLLAALASSACGAPDPSDAETDTWGDENVSTQASNLFEMPGFNRWSNGDVYACFDGGSSYVEAAWVKEALKDSWEAASQVTFHYSDSCPYPGQSRYIRMYWNTGSGWGIGGTAWVNESPQRLQLGRCNAADCLSGGTNFVDYREAFKGMVVHEMGHHLGWNHEQRRPDYVNRDCPLDAPGDGQSETVNGGTYLTPAYDPNSVMSYCRGWDGSNSLAYQGGYRAADRISPGDTRGAQTAYGMAFPYWYTPGVTAAVF